MPSKRSVRRKANPVNRPEPSATQQARTPPRRRQAGRPTEPPTRILITLFRAEGSIGSLASVIYGGVREGARYEAKQRRFLELQSASPQGFPNSPGVWTSLESFALGQVQFSGVVKRDLIFNMLNRALNLVDRNGKLHDFRRVYKNWKWKYQVVEVLTVPRNRMRAFKEAMGGRQRKVLKRESGSSR